MTSTMEWESRLGRHLRVRDLYILSTVVKSGSMAKAAHLLAMSQPAVSQTIANLEHMLGVRLLDRSTRGIEPTIYADVMLRRSMTVFDELKQGVRDIEFLANPTTGELTIGYTDSIAATVFPKIIERFSKEYPRVIIRVEIVPVPAVSFPGLHDRTFDLVVGRLSTPLPDDLSLEDLNMEVLFDDPLVVAASTHSRWAHRRKIDLAELVNEPWILSPPKAASYERVAEAFRVRGLGVPTTSLVTYSIDLRAKLLASGPFISVVPKSLFHPGGDRHQLTMLPVDMPMRPWPVAIVTRKNRTLSPVVERFIECAREVAKSMAGRQGGHPARRRKPNVC